ncbi:MAG TPA: hypothetical protein VFM34_00175 [Moraxellaceae bacterium]|nr:hypothetical protein [Moraxellaceae bacterium]
MNYQQARQTLAAIDADLFIFPNLGGDYTIVDNNLQVLATGKGRAAALIAGGASAQKLSVFDAESGLFLAGTVAQLDRPQFFVEA